MKKKLLSLILLMLYRALRVLNRHDSGVRADLAQLDGTSVRIRAALNDDAPSLAFACENGGLRRCHADEPAQIEISFKSLSCAFRVFTGQMSIGQAYGQHRFVLKGNINETMCLVRAIEAAEGYLFPRFWNRRILKSKTEKQLPTLAVYALLLCGR